MSTSRLFLGAGIVVGATFLWWVFAGSSLVALIDRVATTQHAAPDSPTRFDFDDGKDTVLPEDPKLTFGDRQRAISNKWHVVEQPRGHLTLETPDGSLMLGPIVDCRNLGRGRQSLEFAPEPGDVVTFTLRRSRVSWPRPFDIPWLGGPRTTWGRYIYHRLLWRKANGALLDMVWRDEQRFTNGMGWSDQYLPWPPATKLRVR
jgi:hypothetical protein